MLWPYNHLSIPFGRGREKLKSARWKWFLCTFGSKLPYNVKASSAAGQRMAALASTLDQCNNSFLIAGCGPIGRDVRAQIDSSGEESIPTTSLFVMASQYRRRSSQTVAGQSRPDSNIAGPASLEARQASSERRRVIKGLNEIRRIGMPNHSTFPRAATRNSVSTRPFLTP